MVTTNRNRTLLTGLNLYRYFTKANQQCYHFSHSPMTVNHMHPVSDAPTLTASDVSTKPSDHHEEKSPKMQATTALGAGVDSLRKKSTRHCPIDGCQNKPAPIVGECRYCSSKFCSTHRLPESHMCVGLSACKTSSRLLLSERLLNEKCVAEKL